MNPVNLPPTGSEVDVHDAVKALAFVGDLSMGQPIDHSARTAWLAAALAAALGHEPGVQAVCHDVALLRWSGCTANAPDFSDLMGDDVGVRRAMLASPSHALPANAHGALGALVDIHCEVAGEVARALGLGAATENALRHIFERFDGLGRSHGLPTRAAPFEVFLVCAAGDLEIYSRVYGLAQALEIIRTKAGRQYPGEIVDALARHAADWLHSLEQGAAGAGRPPRAQGALRRMAPLEVIADVIDLKLPWLTGFSRRVAEAARGCSAALGGDADQQQKIYRAGLIHGIGRASVPNTVWDAPGPPGEGAAELLRLVPYWTARAVQRIGSLSAEAEIASFVDERLDGSGFFRGAAGAAISLEGQVLAAAALWVLLQTARPGRPALDKAAAATAMRTEAAKGRFAMDTVAALTGRTDAKSATTDGTTATAPMLSLREIEVLSRISHGESNKEAARALGISPSTVRAHLENVFRKLECTTRAAATLKAMHQGLFSALV